MSTRHFVAACAAALLVLANIASAQQPAAPARAAARATTSSAIPHTNVAAQIDGVLDDPIWKDALVVDLTIETDPRENQPALVQTKAYLIENGAQLLIAFDAKDPDPSSIRAYLRDRDTAFNDDFVGVVLDTFNDARRAFEFFVNPYGVQMDLISDDVNRNESDAWQAIWDSAGRINADGFTVEIAIPFSQLRFPRTEGDQTWGIDVLRFRPRDVRARISNNPMDRNVSCYICQFSKFTGFANAEPGKALEIVPSLTAGRTDSRDATAGRIENGDFDSDVGVGVRWGITPDITADLAINPDFSQVEADVAQLAENTQFALLYTESRPFFLEGAEYYDSPLEVVFTRTVADPDIGAKITGRSGQNTFGLFATNDAVTNLVFPGPLASQADSLAQENDAFVGRYSRGFGKASTIGALVTAREGDGYSNQVAGVDGRYFINDRNTVRFQYVGSHTEYPDQVVAAHAQPAGEFSGDALRLEHRYGSRALYTYFYHQDLDPGFRADSGFIPRVDYEQDNLEAGKIWQGAGNHVWTQLRAGARWYESHDASGLLLERYLRPFFQFNGPLQSFAQLWVGPRTELWDGQEFDLHGWELFSQFRPRSGVYINFQARGGDQIDYANSRVADQIRLQPQIDWNATRHLLMRLRYTSDRLNAKEGPTVFTAKLTDLRLTWQFNVRSFVRLTLQNADVTRNVSLYRVQTVDPSASSLGTQLLYSYKLNPQTVFFAGYSDNHIEDDAMREMVKTGRALFFKLSYAWTPR